MHHPHSGLSPQTQTLCVSKESIQPQRKTFCHFFGRSAVIAAPSIGLLKHHRSLGYRGEAGAPRSCKPTPASWPRLQHVLRMCLPEPCSKLGIPGTSTPRTSGYAPTVAGRHLHAGRRLQPSGIRFSGVSAGTPAWASSLGVLFCKELRAGC